MTDVPAEILAIIETCARNIVTDSECIVVEKEQIQAAGLAAAAIIVLLKPFLHQERPARGPATAKGWVP
jgi:hypothetical protein